jgi:hypothetical protein
MILGDSGVLDPGGVDCRITFRFPDPIDRGSPTSAWSLQALGAPPLIKGGRNNWEFGKGLDTRGANGIFFVQVIQSKRSDGSVLIENGISGRDKTTQIKRGWAEADLVYPLLRGRDV